jgi:hypothetical protein
MAQNTVLAAAQTAATSTDIVLAAGESVTVGIFAATEIPNELRLSLRQDTPSGDNFVKHLTGREPSCVISGPGTFRVYRPLLTSFALDVGVFTET